MHTNAEVSEASITFDEKDPLVLAGGKEKSELYTLTIDGEPIYKNNEELKIK